MRKSKEAAAETRVRIVKAAAASFRRGGVGGVALNDVMGAAGLTHGGFYKHFNSKEQVVAEACIFAADTLGDVLSVEIAAGGGPATGLDRVVNTYLSAQRRDEPEGSCPLAMLGSELARHDEPTRKAATDSFLKLSGILAAEIPEADPEARRRSAIVSMCAMIGALTMSRVVSDQALSDMILSEMRQVIGSGGLRPVATAMPGAMPED